LLHNALAKLDIYGKRRPASVHSRPEHKARRKPCHACKRKWNQMVGREAGEFMRKKHDQGAGKADKAAIEETMEIRERFA
jgi:hypothetical protein